MIQPKIGLLSCAKEFFHKKNRHVYYILLNDRQHNHNVQCHGTRASVHEGVRNEGCEMTGASGASVRPRRFTDG